MSAAERFFATASVYCLVSLFPGALQALEDGSVHTGCDTAATATASLGEDHIINYKSRKVIRIDRSGRARLLLTAGSVAAADDRRAGQCRWRTRPALLRWSSDVDAAAGARHPVATFRF